MNYSNLPAWMMSALCALWFGLMGYKLRKGAVLWCIGGAILGLSISAICLGLAHAVAVPYTPSYFGRLRSIGIIVAVLVIGITGAIIGLLNSKSPRSP
jgi:hypothetical protein